MNLAEHLAQNREKLAKRDLAYWKARAEAAEYDLATETQMRKDQDRRLEKAEARAEAAEKALYILTEPISDAGHTTADGLRHEIEQLRKRVKELQALNPEKDNTDAD